MKHKGIGADTFEQEDAMRIRKLTFSILVFGLLPGTIWAQSYSGDARKIAMGATGYSQNIAAEMIEEERQSRSFVIPLGLIQLLQNTNRFDPGDDSFNPVVVMEYAANPLHFIFNRDSGDIGGRFVKDIVNGKPSRDLNAYRGFVPAGELLAEGLANPNWGKTFKLRRRANGSYQGFYIGVGPYISARTKFTVDQDLIEIFSSSTDIYKPNENILIEDQTIGQLALAITGGYRARFSLPGSYRNKPASRNGIYVGVNYHYLHGFRYEQGDLALQFDTDAQGLVTLNPATTPVALNYKSARSGKGFAMDVGIGAVIDNWEFGFGANGIANRINWEDFTFKQFRLDSWSINGAEFTEHRMPAEISKLKVELPVEYAANAGYHLRNCSVAVEISRGFQGTGFHGGVEYRLGAFELRGGARYGLDRWHPSGGVGLNLGKRFSIDVAGFGTTTNVERRLKPGIALSLRFNRVEN